MTSPPPTDRDWLRVSEAKRVLGKPSVSTIGRWGAAGALERRKDASDPRGSWLYSRRSVEACALKLRVGGVPTGTTPEERNGTDTDDFQGTAMYPSYDALVDEVIAHLAGGVDAWGIIQETGVRPKLLTQILRELSEVQQAFMQGPWPVNELEDLKRRIAKIEVHVGVRRAGT